jgi:hypothetical protein
VFSLQLQLICSNLISNDLLNIARTTFKQLVMSLLDFIRHSRKGKFDVVLVSNFVFLRFPSPLTYVGMLTMANVYLPITANWRNFFEKCEQDAATVNDVAAKALGSMAHTIATEMSVEKK